MKSFVFAQIIFLICIDSQHAILSNEITPPNPIQPVAYKIPSLGADLSALFPGLRPVHLNDIKTAGGLVSRTRLGAGLALLCNLTKLHL